MRIGRGAIVLGENCPVGIARGDCPRWQFSGDNCLGDNCSGGGGGNCPGGSCPVPKIKSLFTIFEGLSVAKNCLKLESVPLRI